jgi:hypothetical protein
MDKDFKHGGKKIDSYRKRARLGGWLGLALQPISLLLIGSLNELEGMSAKAISF